jgi:3-oxoacyl-[acyl-carrier protein] reductase
MVMLLEGKVAWVTGASRGIGKETAIALAAEGASVVMSAREVDHLKDTAAQIKEMGAAEPMLLAYDLTDKTRIKEAFLSVQKTYKRLDAIVNNAGILESALLGMISEEMLDRVFSINTYSVIYHMQYASRMMARQRSGSIVNVSSILGRFGGVGEVVYSGSKAALIGASFSAAKELAPVNVRVNVVAPGFIDTDMVRQIPQEKYDEHIASIKMGRIGKPEDVAHMITFLASDRATYVTGQVIGVDGGMLI